MQEEIDGLCNKQNNIGLAYELKEYRVWITSFTTRIV